MPGAIGPMEIGIVLLLALVVFGPKKLPELGRGAGQGLREFKQSLTLKAPDDEPAERAES
jgi:sec-independent protein translocase protein TatA